MLLVRVYMRVWGLIAGQNVNDMTGFVYHPSPPSTTTWPNVVFFLTLVVQPPTGHCGGGTLCLLV